jgi:hypothetical protein
MSAIAIFRATPGTFLLVSPGVPQNIANATDKPARAHDRVAARSRNLFEELAKAVTRDCQPNARAIRELRRRYDTDQLSAGTPF